MNKSEISGIVHQQPHLTNTPPGAWFLGQVQQNLPFIHEEDRRQKVQHRAVIRLQRLRGQRQGNHVSRPHPLQAGAGRPFIFLFTIWSWENIFLVLGEIWKVWWVIWSNCCGILMVFLIFGWKFQNKNGFVYRSPSPTTIASVLRWRRLSSTATWGVFVRWGCWWTMPEISDLFIIGILI